MSSDSSTLLKSYILAKKIVNSLTSGKKKKKKETKYSAIGAMRNIGYKHNNCLRWLIIQDDNNVLLIKNMCLKALSMQL